VNADAVKAAAEAMVASPNGPWLTLPGPVSIAPGLAEAAVAAAEPILLRGHGRQCSHKACDQEVYALRQEVGRMQLEIERLRGELISRGLAHVAQRR
jgi:hypothetical protein